MIKRDKCGNVILLEMLLPVVVGENTNNGGTCSANTMERRFLGWC